MGGSPGRAQELDRRPLERCRRIYEGFSKVEVIFEAGLLTTVSNLYLLAAWKVRHHHPVHLRRSVGGERNV